MYIVISYIFYYLFVILLSNFMLLLMLFYFFLEWKPFSFAGGAHLEFIRRETYHRNNVLQEKSVSRQKRSLQSGQNYVSLRFRTQKDSGLLWYASSKNKFSMLAVSRFFSLSYSDTESFILLTIASD